MVNKFTKSQERRVRELAKLAWDRQLRAELTKIGDAINSMNAQHSTPHDVVGLIHEFHNGISREMFNGFSSNKPWLAVCRAHYDGVLTDDDIAGDSETIRNGINEYANDFRLIDAIDT